MKSILVIAGAAFLLASAAGCTKLQEILFHPGANACSAATCKIDVDIKACTAGGECFALKPDDEKKHIAKGPSVQLIWTVPQGYGFCEGDGVKFDPATPQMQDGWPTDDEVNQAPQGGQHRKYHWKDLNTVGGEFPYLLRFHKKDDCGGPAIEKDPVIINDM